MPVEPVALTGVRLLDARSAVAVEDATIVIGADGRIAAAGASSGVTVDASVRAVPARGLTIVPGLVDCHVHFAGMFAPLHDEVQLSPTDATVRALKAGRAFLGAGVTTARDAGWATAGIRRAFESGDFPGPRLQISVVGLSQTGGHGDGVSNSGIDLMPPPVPDLPSGVCDGVEEVRRVVRRVIRAGADWIKVFATGGVFSTADKPTSSQFSVEELRVMVEEAEAAGLRGVMAHAEGARGIKNAIRAGVKSIEHADLIDDEGIDLLLEHDIPVVPTFLIARESAREERIARGEIPPWAVDKARMLDAEHGTRFRRSVERGVRIAMGTDGSLGLHPPEELALMVAHGLDAHAALRAATLEAATLLGLDNEIGTLEVGKQADLLAIDFDPLAEPGRWAEPDRVVLVTRGGTMARDRRGVLGAATA